LDDLLSGISHHLDDEASERKAIYIRLVAIENEMKRRGSRGFARYLVAFCIGVAAILAWQSYGEATKQIIATRAPELGWSPEAKQIIASWAQQLGWTKRSSRRRVTRRQLNTPTI
jgi:TRAP-type C4-dicarboxylate transport system permease small subunit